MTTDSSSPQTMGVLRRLERLWFRLIEPAIPVQDLQRRHQLRLISGMALASTVLGFILGVLILPLAANPDNPFGSPIVLPGLISSILPLVIYFQSRAGRFYLSALMLIALGILGPWVSSITYPNMASIMLVGVLFSFLFLPGLGVIATAGFSLVLMLLLPVIRPEISLETVLPLVEAQFIISALFYVARRHLDNVAQDQRAVLEQRNEAFTRQAGEIDRVFRSASVGNFDARAEVFSDDEMGRAVQGVNAMLGQFNGLIQRAESERATFMESFAGVVGLSDMEGNVTYLNLAGAQMLGYDDPGKIVGVKSFSEFLMPEDLKTTTEIGIPTAINKGSWTAEGRLMRVDGTVVPVEQTVFVIQDEQGNPRSLGVLMTDITARKYAEANLAEALAVAKMTYVKVDVLSQMLYFDENFSLVFGELDGQEGSRAMLIETFTQRHVHPDSVEDFQTFQREFGAAVETDNLDFTSQVVVRVIRANGEEGVVIGRARNLRDAEGVTLSFALTFQDITELRLAEAQLAAQNEALGNALDELRLLITNVDFAAQQLTGASESIVDVVTLLTGQASTSARLAEEAALSAQEGNQAVSDTILAMGRIRESSQETTRRIKRLGEASQEIGEVVRLIDEIADRVTILALNASIQAAAAGEAGRGFAVVAEEVQRLAERATNATRQIENMVKSIQGEINEAMIGVEEATREVVDGSQLAQSAGERIADLNQAVGDLSNLVQHVADTTSMQTTEALASLAALAADLQASVSALDIPAESSQLSDNGGKVVMSDSL